MEIKGATAVVTGAASGIGHAVSVELARRGAKMVALVDRSSSVGESAEQIKREWKTDVLYFTGDATDPDFRKHIFDAISKMYGPVSICVPAAGITDDALAVKMNKNTGEAEIYPLETFRKVVEVDFIAPIYWALETVAGIAKSRMQQNLKRWTRDEPIQGVIVFLGSVSSIGVKGQIAYSSSKAGLEGAAATLSKEAIYHGVQCSIIHPGFTDTPMVRALGEGYIRTHILPYTQLGRLIRPDEIADAICFMISNSTVTGHLWADAGWHPSAA